MIDRKILQYLCCPKCKSNLVKSGNFLACEKCGEKYEIKNDIPILVNLNNLLKHLQGQIKYFEKEDKNRTEFKLEEWQKSYLERLRSSFSLKEGETLIDVGTGSGYIAIELAKKGLKVIACDLTLKELIKLKNIIHEEHLEDNLFLVCCSAEQLPFKNRIADYLVSNAVLEHLPKEGEALQEISRVCKSKSGLMVTVPLSLKYVLPFFWPVNIIHDKRIGHLRRYNDDDLRKKFEKYRFKIKKVFYTGHFVKVMGVLATTVFKIKASKLDRILENIDKKKKAKKYGASNICVTFFRA